MEGSTARFQPVRRPACRERQFDDLDVFNRGLAVSEILAHLDVLAVAGRLRRSDTDGTSYYARA